MYFTIKTKALILLSLLFFSCSGKEKGAGDYLNDAEKAYEESNYSLAKLKIDSIKLLFPKSFNEINTGFKLLQTIRLAENRRNMVYCDSMLNVKYLQLKEMLSLFDYVRDERYQEFGEYYPKSYPHQASLSKSGIRSGVREKGTFFIESILLGSAIRHNKVRVSTHDGNFSETLAVTSDGLNYRFSTQGAAYEIVRYIGNDENGVARFIYTFRDQPISIQFFGTGVVTVKMSEASKNGLSDSFELSSLLLDIEQLKLEKEKSEALILYLENKKQ